MCELFVFGPNAALNVGLFNYRETALVADFQKCGLLHVAQEAQMLMAVVVGPSDWAVLGAGAGAGGGVMRSVNVCGLNVIVHN